MSRSSGAVLLNVMLVLAVAASGCTREERSLNARAALVVERVPGGARALEMEGRVHDTQLTGDNFSRAWDAVTRGAAVGGGLALTLASANVQPVDGTTLLVGFTLVLPTPLRAGNTIPAAHVLPASREMPMYWSTWGPHPLRDAANAEIALRTFDYRAVGMVVENEFIAEAVSGAVTVVSRSGDQLVLRLDITATASGGRQVRLNGDVTVSAERYRPPFS